MEDELQLNTFDYKKMVGKSIILIGPSGTGKGVLIRDIMYNMKDIVPTCLVICPTESQNESYKGFIPDAAIIKNVTRERLISKLSKFYQRQERNTRIYNMVNDISKLRTLVNTLGAHNESIDKVEQLFEKCKINLQTFKESLEKNQEDTNIMTNIEKTNQQIVSIKEKLRKQYKRAIEESDIDPEDDPRNPEQIEICDNLHINPNVLLILDDIAANLDTQLQKTEVFRKYFFQGRHNNITLIIAIQDDKKLIPELRQNGFYILFTDSNSLLSYIKSNNGTINSVKQTIGKLELYKKEFVKVLYNREQNQYNFVRGRMYADFKFGSEVFWDFCEQIKKIR